MIKVTGVTIFPPPLNLTYILLFQSQMGDYRQEPAPGEALTHGLQIMRLRRCLLRYGGTADALSEAISLRKLLHRGSDQKSMQRDRNTRLKYS